MRWEIKVKLLPLIAVLLCAAGCVPPPPRSTQAAPQADTPQPTARVASPVPGPDRLDRSNPNSILEWVNFAIAQRNPDPILALLKGNTFGYAFYIEGGQEVTRQDFASQLTQRINAGPRCVGYSVDEYSMQVWVDGWVPAWEMTESCYMGCDVLDPPHQSHTAGLLFGISEGEWELAALYLNPPDLYYFMDQPLKACSQPYDRQSALATIAAAKSCPGAPTQRLVVGEQAEVCTLRDSVFMRNAPDRSADRIGRYAPGSAFEVLYGPFCADSWSWWRVQDSAGNTGWMSEGGDAVDPYFLCPAP